MGVIPFELSGGRASKVRVDGLERGTKVDGLYLLHLGVLIVLNLFLIYLFTDI